ncbi:hypothetical protein GCM10020331_015100 [Ectobacillus funiculus]
MIALRSNIAIQGTFHCRFFQKHLLVLELNGYKFPFGAAHGMPTEVYVHIDVRDGTLYQLEDLFIIKDSNYVKVLSDIIKQQIETEKSIFVCIS